MGQGTVIRLLEVEEYTHFPMHWLPFCLLMVSNVVINPKYQPVYNSVEYAFILNFRALTSKSRHCTVSHLLLIQCQK